MQVDTAEKIQLNQLWGIETFGEEEKKYRRYIFVTPSCQCLKLKQYYLVEGYDYPKRWLDSYILHD